MGQIGQHVILFNSTGYLGLGYCLPFIFSSYGLCWQFVFYNAYLPEIAAPQDQDRISAKGFTYGYIGSVIMNNSFALVIFIKGNEGYAYPDHLFIGGIWWVSLLKLLLNGLPKSVISLR